MAVVYEDGYVKLTETHITIKWYYFPYGSKVISYREIASFGRAPDFHINALGTKTWGMALSMIWWSWGPLGRECYLNEQLIIELKGQPLKSGFTSRNTQKVLEILGRFCTEGEARAPIGD
jgi:hypothetical protein